MMIMSAGESTELTLFEGGKNILMENCNREKLKHVFWDKKTFGPTVTSSVLMVDGIIVTVSGSGFKQR